MRVFYSDRFTLPLPEGHRFPMEKYRMLRDRLLSEGILRADEISEAPIATREEVIAAHTPAYVDSIIDGSVDPQILKQIGLPWSPALADRSFSTVGGAMAAAHEALVSGVSGNLAGGTHHAHADAGEGFCVFNDIAVVIMNFLRQGVIRRAAIVDLDVHQGNGNSSILGQRDDVFIFSMHGARNYPFKKIPSTLDIDLPDGTGDDEYLHLLAEALPRVFAFEPDLVFFQAGVDPLKEDRLGKLSLSLEGLSRRDRLVLETCHNKGIPVSLAMGGGYARPIDLTVEAHLGTYRAAKDIFRI